LFELGPLLFFPVKRRAARKVCAWREITFEEQQQMKEVVEIWTGAANLGDCIAQYNLGIMHNEGRGMVKNNEEAARWELFGGGVRWYRKAVD
jgi:TPR repeat protein